jgi:hypothetical protein
MHDEILGDLIQVNENTFQTVRKLDIEYTWPTSHWGYVDNIVFQKLTISYNYITNQISSPLSDISRCKVETAYCKLSRETYIWNYHSKYKCPERYLSQPDNEMYYIYYDTNDEIVHF